MNREGIFKHAVVAFLFALGLYLVAFFGIERVRQAKGPWHVAFKTDQEGRPSMIVSQPQMKIANVKFVFQDERLPRSNLAETVVFDWPKTNLPFGQVIFLDTTFLPGAVTLDLFGHEIELLPRVLGVNRREVSWKSDSTIELSPKDKAPPRPVSRKGR